MKKCTKCGFEKPLSEFFKHNQKKDGLRPDCKICSEISSSKSRAKNPQKYIDHANKWKLRNPEKRRIILRDFYCRNKEKIQLYSRRRYVKNRERLLLQTKEWSKRNPTKRIAIWLRRRARELKVSGSHTANDIERILKAQSWRCAYCACSLKSDFHVDHIIPILRGGSNYASNLQMLCPTCNLRKGAKPPEIFAQELGLLI